MDLEIIPQNEVGSMVNFQVMNMGFFVFVILCRAKDDDDRCERCKMSSNVPARCEGSGRDSPDRQPGCRRDGGLYGGVTGMGTTHWYWCDRCNINGRARVHSTTAAFQIQGP
eukprot:1291763-Amorphochlora_amoeboformis.AAC.1